MVYTKSFYEKRIQMEKQIIKDLKEDGHYKEAGEVSDHIKWLREQINKLKDKKE